MACTTDNASNNDTLMNKLQATCQDRNIEFIVVHMINLAAQDAFSNLKVGYVENESEILNQNSEISKVIPKVNA